jgi:hypothetical protein
MGSMFVCVQVVVVQVVIVVLFLWRSHALSG